MVSTARGVTSVLRDIEYEAMHPMIEHLRHSAYSFAIVTMSPCHGVRAGHVQLTNATIVRAAPDSLLYVVFAFYLYLAACQRFVSGAAQIPQKLGIIRQANGAIVLRVQRVPHSPVQFSA